MLHSFSKSRLLKQPNELFRSTSVNSSGSLSLGKTHVCVSQMIRSPIRFHFDLEFYLISDTHVVSTVRINFVLLFDVGFNIIQPSRQRIVSAVDIGMAAQNTGEIFTSWTGRLCFFVQAPWPVAPCKKIALCFCRIPLNPSVCKKYIFTKHTLLPLSTKKGIIFCISSLAKIVCVPLILSSFVILIMTTSRVHITTSAFFILKRRNPNWNVVNVHARNIFEIPRLLTNLFPVPADTTSNFHLSIR